MDNNCIVCKLDLKHCICKSEDLNAKEHNLINELDNIIENLEHISKESKKQSKDSNEIKEDLVPVNKRKEDNITSKDSLFAIFIDGLIDSKDKEKLYEILKKEEVDIENENFSTKLNESKILIKGLNEVKAYLLVSKINKLNCKVDAALESEIITIINKANLSNRIYSPLDLSKSVLLYTTDSISSEFSFKYVSYVSESLVLDLDNFKNLMEVLENKIRLKAYELGANAVIGLKLNFIDTSFGIHAYMYGTAIKINV